MKQPILAFNLNSDDYQIEQFGDGLINFTWKVSDRDNQPQFILQRINTDVFKAPQDIADNINNVGKYLSLNAQDYLFVSPLPAACGDYLLKYSDGNFYRLFPYVKNSVTINAVQTPNEAFEAAQQFARFTRLLEDFDSSKLHYTLPGFHDLNMRIKQFKGTVMTADENRLQTAKSVIEKVYHYQNIVATYENITQNQLIPLRVIHHDTKISNVLFDAHHKGMCVIDLDTVMPGYFISDVGDMMRTYLSPVTEEEQDFDKIEVRTDFFVAIMNGYFSEMADVLTQAEKSRFVYAGKFMIYMQAIRFLTDYLNNDAYYHTSYPGQNLVRAQNQFTLLEKYEVLADTFQQLINKYRAD